MAGKNRSKLSETTNISQLTGCIGAELTGFELDRLDKFDAAFIYKALLKHQVVFFRNQGSIAVEKILPLFSPSINKIEIIKKGKVRRAKLFYLRKRKGKQAKIKQKI